MLYLILQEPRRLYQVDLVPSLTLLLGLPIPFSNLGAVIPELFGWQGFQAMPTNPQEYLRPLEALHLNALQVCMLGVVVCLFVLLHAGFSWFICSEESEYKGFPA